MNPLLIFGASTRAAAFSAIRAGFDPICGDMFADADLRAWAITVDVPHYPRGLAKAVGHLSAMPLIYTGALENSPTELDRLSQRHILWGNASNSLRLCRDPWFCRDILLRAGLPALELCSSTSPPPRDGQWLIKPLRSAGGRAISVWGAETKAIRESHYFQQRATGTPMAATFLAHRDGVELLGISRQLIGQAELHAPDFGYCGSILASDSTMTGDAWFNPINQMGSVIAQECGLTGLFGIDLICEGQNALLTEVNPRYTASMELVEFQVKEPLIEWHRVACEGDAVIVYSTMPRACNSSNASPASRTKAKTTSVHINRAPPTYYGKVVLYADRPARAPNLTSRIPHSISLTTLPDLADIPVADTEIQPGQPVFTCLGEGSDPDRMLLDLVRGAKELWASF